MALDLKAACGSVVRPDIAPRTIKIRAGIHTGYIYVVSSSSHLSHDFGKADGTHKTVGMIQYPFRKDRCRSCRIQDATVLSFWRYHQYVF